MGSGGTKHLIQCLSAALPALLLAGDAGAIPRGEINSWLESRYYRYGPYNREIALDNAIFHSDGQLLPSNGGIWHYWGDFTRDAREAYVAADDMPTRFGRLNLRLGDYALGLSRENILRREFRQDVLIRGGGLSIHRNRLALSLDAGSITQRSSILGIGRDDLNTNLYSARLNGNFRAHGEWSAQWTYQDDSPLGNPGRHIGEVFIGRHLHNGLSLLSEGRVSKSDLGETGTSLVGGFDYRAERGAVGVHLRRVSEAFLGQGLQRDPHVNEFGGRLQATIRPSREFLASVIADWGRDINDRSKSLRPEERILTRFHFSAGLTGPTYLQGYVNYRNRTTDDPDSLLVDQHTISGRAEIGIRARKGQASVSYGRGLFRNVLDEGNDWHEDRIDLRAYGKMSRLFRTEFQGRYAERRLPDGRWTSRERRAELRLYLEGAYDRRLWISGGRERQDAEIADFSHENWLLGFGFDYPLPGGLSLGMDGFSAVSVDGSEPETFRWNARVAKRFSFGGGRLRGNENVEEFGRVSGTIFADLNGNKKRDKNEPGIPDQLLSLGSGPAVTTGEDGSFSFAKTATVMDNLVFHKTHLPTRFLSPDDHVYDLRLRAGEHKQIDIPVQLSSGFGGRVVYVDAEGKAHPISGVLIRVVGSHRDAFTDEAGRYMISGLPAGNMTLEVVDWSLPEDFKVKGEAMREIILNAGEAVRVEDIQLRHQPKSTLQWFRQEEE